MRNTLSSYDGLALALRLRPAHLARDTRHLVIGIGDRFQRPILRVRACGLEGHHEGLSGRVHRRIGDQEALLVQAIDDLEAHADPVLDRGASPGLTRLHRGFDESIGVDGRIGNAERHAVGRDLTTDLLRTALPEVERLA